MAFVLAPFRSQLRKIQIISLQRNRPRPLPVLCLHENNQFVGSLWLVLLRSSQMGPIRNYKKIREAGIASFVLATKSNHERTAQHPRLPQANMKPDTRSHNSPVQLSCWHMIFQAGLVGLNFSPASRCRGFCVGVCHNAGGESAGPRVPSE